MTQAIEPTAFDDTPSRVIVLDSVSHIKKEHTRCIIVCGSHCGISAAEHTLPFSPLGIIFNDAGKGKDDAGIKGLELLQEQKHPIPAATVCYMSARIGDGMDTYEFGKISAFNTAAEDRGVAIGMTAKKAIKCILREQTTPK